MEPFRDTLQFLIRTLIDRFRDDHMITPGLDEPLGEMSRKQGMQFHLAPPHGQKDSFDIQ
jgi:hypothetical protein